MAERAPEGQRKQLTVSRMAERLGISSHTLRYYESEGLITPGRTSGGQRRYLPDDEDEFRTLIELRVAGMPLAQLRVYSQLRDERDVSAQRLDLLAAHEAHLCMQLVIVRRHLRAAEKQHACHQSE